MAIDARFLGTGWAFPPTFDSRTRQAEMVSHEEDIRQSLHILFGTEPGERVMQPEYGCGLRHAVFEVIDAGTLTTIRDLISRAVLFHEVRITLEHIDFDTTEVMRGVLRIVLDYTIRSTNSRSNLVYPFYLREGTHLELMP